jgi:hypothetical protein
MSENVGASTSRKSKGLHGLYRDSLMLRFYSFITSLGLNKNINRIFRGSPFLQFAFHCIHFYVTSNNDADNLLYCVMSCTPFGPITLRDCWFTSKPTKWTVTFCQRRKLHTKERYNFCPSQDIKLILAMRMR